MSALISTSELEAALAKPEYVVVNGSWHMPSEQRNPLEEHLREHIPGAVFFDIDAVSDTTSPYPHMLPSAEQFAQSVSALGIRNDSNVVVYDSLGLFSAARIWWMFRVFGHNKVQVLDGGLPRWLHEKRSVESGASPVVPSAFKATYHPELVRSYEQVLANVTTRAEQVIDARASGRFNGTEPEPRAGLRSGHIEGSMNIPFRECTTPPHHTLKTPDELKAIFAARGIDLNRPVTATCGSGVTACVLALALHQLGKKEVAVYDGAWAEWASRS